MVSQEHCPLRGTARDVGRLFSEQSAEPLQRSGWAPTNWEDENVKVELYNQMVRGKMSRRNVLKGAASAGALAAMGGAVPAFAGGHSSLRAEILKVPGVGMGSPTDADWQKVGGMCLGPTK